MARYSLKTSSSSSYFSLMWALLILSIGVFLVFTTITTMPLFSIIGVVVVSFGVCFLSKSVKNINEIRSGNYPISLETDSNLVIEYANGKRDVCRYNDIKYVNVQNINDMRFLVLEWEDGAHHTLTIEDIDPYFVAGEIKVKNKL